MAADSRMAKDAECGLIRLTGWVGLVSNLLLAAFKFTAGFVANSQAVMADAVHSLSDSVSDLAIIIGVKFWSAPADKNHPHGHRRIETLVTLSIGVLLLALSAGILYRALAGIHEVHKASEAPGVAALVAALISIAGKEILYRWTIRVGRRIRSSAVVANAWHHRTDALSSIPAALAVLCAILLPEWQFLDHVGAIIVSLFILRAGWKISLSALKELTDSGASDAERDQIAGLAMCINGVREVHAVRARRVGSGLHVDLHVNVNGDLTVRKGHAISEEVKSRILSEGPDVLDVVVHLEPCDQDDD